jgi:uncharacterized protein YllA (UPF0747 family)
VTANVSSSSVSSPPDTLRVDLAAAGLLPPLPRAYLEARDLDLLTPLRFVPPAAAAVPDLGAVLAAAARPAAATLRHRAELAAALEVSNRSYGHRAAAALCRRLADPATRVVVTGQQPGLFGGPLLTFSKLVAASRWAAALEAAGEPAVAVFWVATEDHDYAEVAHATVLSAAGPRRFDLGPAGDAEALLPVGMRTLTPAVGAALRGMAEAVPGEAYAEWLRTLARWYLPDARFGEAFCRAVAHMLGEHCPLLLDAMHPALKAAERPWLARLIERRQALEEALANQEERITGRGFSLQVSPQPGASPLFLLRHGARRRIEWRGAEGFALRGGDPAAAAATGPAAPREPAAAASRTGASERVADLLRIVEENPAVVSPGVLARPAIADAVLGTTLQVLGPGELSYIGQAAAVYPVLELPAPSVALRPQALVLESHQLHRLEETGLTLAELLGPRAGLDRLLAQRAGADFVAPARGRIEAELDALRAPALAADADLERPLGRTRARVLRALDLFAARAMPALARRDAVLHRRVEALRQICLPGGQLQERVVCAAYFQGRVGDRLAAGFWEQMNLDPRHLSVIVP